MYEKINKKIKACIAGIVACALVIGIFIAGLAVIKTSNTNMNSNNIQSKVYSKLIIAALPKTITGDDNGKKVTFHMALNKDFDASKDEPIRQFIPYYFDENDKRIDLPTGVYKSPKTGETMQVTVGFFLKGSNKLKVMASVIKVVIALLLLASIGLIILLSFYIWSLKQDKKDAQQYDEIKKRFDKKKD